MTTDSNLWVNTVDGLTINRNQTSKIAVNADQRFYDIQLIDGTTATLSRHVALNAIPYDRLPTATTPPIQQSISDPYPPLSDAQWLLQNMRRVGKVSEE